MRAAVPQIQFQVERFLGGIRVDSFMARHLRNYSQWTLSRMVQHGAVTINDRLAELTDRVHSSQTVKIRLIEPPDKLYDAQQCPISIIYEDPWTLVLNKAAGMITHPVGNFQSGTVCHALQNHFDRQTKAKGLLRPGLVHRLDRMTSGLLIVAKQHQSHRVLGSDFENGRLRKCYLAMVAGRIEFERTTIERPIGFHPDGNSVLMSCDDHAVKPRLARTDVCVLKRYRHRTLVSCELHTGRNHQIRVHLAAMGHPILGDEFYLPHGGIRPNRFQDTTNRRHALHAGLLQIRHPIFGSLLTFRAPPGNDFWDCIWQAESCVQSNL